MPLPPASKMPFIIRSSRGLGEEAIASVAKPLMTCSDRCFRKNGKPVYFQGIKNRFPIQELGDDKFYYPPELYIEKRFGNSVVTISIL